MPKCRYCQTALSGQGKQVCSSVECQERMKRERMMKGRENAKARNDKKREKRLRENPVHCVRCGLLFTLEDSLKSPACHHPDCQNWWASEVIRRREVRQAANAKKKPKKRRVVQAPHDSREIPPEEFFSQAIYDREQAANAKKNKRTCMGDNCNKSTFGPNHFCDTCRARNFRIADGSLTDGHWGGGDGDKRRAFQGVLG